MSPPKHWAVLFTCVVVGLYYPATRVLEPSVRELWFQHVTRAMVEDGSHLRPPHGKVWLGASRPELPESTYGLHQVEALLGTRLAIAAFYQSWGAGDAHAFPADVLESLRRGHYLPMITWEPWLTEFPQVGGENPEGSLRRIASGEFDVYIATWARAAARHGRPFFLRIGHEMTNPWYGWAPRYGNTAEDYVAFFRHVHAIFEEQGARNAIFVWTPFTNSDMAFFPGRDVVDWLGLDIFNFGHKGDPPVWFDFASVLAQRHTAYAELGLPVMLAEVGTSSSGGDKAAWLADMFETLASERFPKVHAVVFFDHPRGETGGGLSIDWSLAEVAPALRELRESSDFLARATREGIDP